MSIIFKDNSADVLRALHMQCEDALRKIGEQAVDHAKKEIDRAKRVDTGELRNSIRAEVREDGVYVGTNNDYAAFHELGTGRFTHPHAGAPYGVSAIHYLHHAASRHTAEYRKILKEEMKK